MSQAMRLATGQWEASRSPTDPRASRAGFIGACTVLFIASAALTMQACTSMAEMGAMKMPGGWTMSMAWMRMPGQTWLGAAASFLGMWVVMMVAMMLPSLVPMLGRYRRSVRATGEGRWAALTTRVAAGYFLVWSALGLAVFPIGIALASATMQWPVLSSVVPLGVGLVVIASGALQFTAWKSRHLDCCRHPVVHRRLSPDAASAWRHGLRLGVHCTCCCSGPMATLLVVGVMDLRAMALVTVAMALERLGGEPIARAVGIVMMCTGTLLVVQAALG